MDIKLTGEQQNIAIRDKNNTLLVEITDGLVVVRGMTLYKHEIRFNGVSIFAGVLTVVTTSSKPFNKAISVSISIRPSSDDMVLANSIIDDNDCMYSSMTLNNNGQIGGTKYDGGSVSDTFTSYTDIVTRIAL